MKIFKVLLFTFLLLAASGLKHTNAQCAMCRQSAESSLKEGKSNRGAGLNKGILYLMAVPYMMGAIGLGVYFYQNRKAKEAAFVSN